MSNFRIVYMARVIKELKLFKKEVEKNIKDAKMQINGSKVRI